jgi:hypothetical protein
VNPAERKRKDRERHCRGFSEYRHALRHGKWRRKTRAAQKVERQGVAQRLLAFVGAYDAELVEVDLVLPARRRVRKWGPCKLGDWIDGRLARRAALEWRARGLGLM